jgi:hypothetical protein
MTARVVTTLDRPARRRLIDRFGPEVAGWCDGLPGLVGSVCGAWRLRVRRALPAGGTSVVFECAAHDGDSVVLKLTPDHRIAAGEAAALATSANSPYVVRLLDSDLDRGALLLECLRPGLPLSQDPAGWTLADIAPVLADLWSPRPHPAADVVPRSSCTSRPTPPLPHRPTPEPHRRIPPSSGKSEPERPPRRRASAHATWVRQRAPKPRAGAGSCARTRCCTRRSTPPARSPAGPT